MSIENSFDRIATALEGIATRIDALGAAIAAMNGGKPTTGPTFVQGGSLNEAILAEVAPLKEALATATPAELVQAAVTEPKKRGRPALKAVETAPEAAPLAPEAAPVEDAPDPKSEGAPAKPAPTTPAPADAPAATEDAVKTAILAFAGKRGKQAAIDILSRHGAARVRDLDPTTYGAVLADIAKG